jgi:sugar/nucleoside kinase (ribokinase family)
VRKSQGPVAFGVGLVALDLVQGGSLPPGHVRSWAGGTCGNVLTILAYLGWRVYPVARLNDDAAARRVRADMGQWGVGLEFVGCGPVASTPIVVQQIRRLKSGQSSHRFTWKCPRCGTWLPSFKPLTLSVVKEIEPALSEAKVFFIDRLSPANVALARSASAAGALVVFEPSARSDPRLLAEIVGLAHVIKYAQERLAVVGGAMTKNSATMLEVQTLGANGLRYRHRFSGQPSGWLQLPGVATSSVLDTCGAGDWCTAGILAKIGRNGRDGLRSIGAAGVKKALEYGQALAAWNCGFEGARGGMYQVTKKVFENQVTRILRVREHAAGPARLVNHADAGVPCPACS